MKFKELPKFWKMQIIILSSLTALFLLGLIAFQVFLTDMRNTNAEKRNVVMKPDNELKGARLEIPRDGKDSVKCVVYLPDNIGNEKLPVIFNFHGGGFMLGDADEMDTQCDNWANDWNAVIVSVNYTKPDISSISYGVQEGVDTVMYFKAHADEYHANISKFSVIGHSAGGYYAARVAIGLDNQGFQLASQILCCTWTKGLPKKISPTLAPALFVLGSDDPISQNSYTYQERLKEIGVSVTVNEYEGGKHPFLATPYPELSRGFTDEEKAEFVNDEQKALAVKAENDIKEWLNENVNKK